MVDFFKFKESLEEAKVKQAKKPSEMDEKLEKDADDPCQAGWVQLGMKTKNGKQVPNCVPLDEARKQMKNESASYEDDIDPNKEIVVKGTKGMNSKSFTKKFRNMKAADKWMDDNEDDIEIKQVMNESVLNEGSADTRRFMKQIVQAFKPISRKEKIAKTFSYKPGKDYASVPVIITYNKSEDEYASYIWSPRLKDMLHHDFYGDLDDAVDDAKFEIKDNIDRSGEFVPGRQRLRMGESVKNESTLVEGYYDAPDYGPIGASEMAQTQLHFIKYAADDVINCLKKGCPMPEWYQNKLAKLEGDMEGLYSYMKGKTRKMQAHQSDRYGMMGMGRGMYEQTLTEAKSGDKEAYTKFFNAALKKFGVKSPAELKGEKEKEFYDYVDKNWKADDEKNESTKYVTEKLKPSDDVSKWIEDFYASDAPQFKGKDKEARREMAVAAWLEARREAGYDVDKNPNE